MKKPNIKNGNWVNDGITVYNKDGDKVCYVLSVEEGSQNIQAISAVPEMIDALMECTTLLQEMSIGESIDSDRILRLSVKSFQALIKAGCTE